MTALFFSKHQRKVILDIFTYTLLILGILIILVPLFWLVTTALKTNAQIFQFPPKLLPDPVVWRNFIDALTYSNLPFPRFFLNSFIITVLSTLGALMSSVIVAFAFSRIQWKGRDILFIIVILTMIIPKEITIVPEFIIFRTLGWTDSFLPLIVPSFFGHPFYIFILRQYMMTFSKELDHAAKIDGCNTWMVFYKIILPLCKLPLLTVMIFSVQNSWNDFLSPLVYLNSTKNLTVSLGLNMFNGQYGTQWGLLMAASLLVMLPILILFAVAQKHFIQGIVVTGIK